MPLSNWAQSNQAVPAPVVMQQARIFTVPVGIFPEMEIRCQPAA